MMLALLASAALAGVCDADTTGLPTGPAVAGLYDGDLGRARRVCGRTEVGVSGGGLLLADAPNFYGHIVAGGSVDGSYATGDLEVFGSVEAFRYDTVIGALTAAYTGLGHTEAGATWRFSETDTTALGLTGRVVLPTAFGLYRNAWPVGLDLGVNAHRALTDKVSVHGQVSAVGSAALGRGDADPRIGLAPLVGVSWRPIYTFGVVVDVGSTHGLWSPVDVLGTTLGLRAGGERFGFEAGATFPLAGRERALTRAELRGSWRL